MHSNDESFYCLVLADYAAPSFCSFGKKYFGSLELIEHLIHSIKVDRRYADDYKQLINTFEEYMAGNISVTHNVAYNAVLFLEPVTIYAKENSVADFNKYEHLNVWGFPKQIEIKDDVVTNTLYVTEKIFEDEKEMLEDVESFRNSQDPLFERIFEDIFGDG